MTTIPTLAAIFNAIVLCYGSLEQPDFSFAEKAMAAGAWDSLVHELRERITIDEITDLNNDVSRTFQVRIDGRHVATLQLSFVGPYAVYFRHEGWPWKEIFVDRTENARNDVEAFVVDTCEKHGVSLLGLDILRTPATLKLFDTESDRVRIYQALFSDVEFVPGEYEELLRDTPSGHAM